MVSRVGRASVSRTYVVTYDVANDKLRSRVSSLLESRGERVQESVFECRLSEAALAEMTRTLAQLLASDPRASVRFYPVCASCLAGATGLGRIVPRRSSGPCVVV